MDKFEEAIHTILKKSHYAFETECDLLSILVKRNKSLPVKYDDDNFVYLVCPTCGATLFGNKNQKFCQECGQRLEG